MSLLKRVPVEREAVEFDRHACFTPSLKTIFRERNRFGAGTQWECKKCGNVWQVAGRWYQQYWMKLPKW